MSDIRKDEPGWLTVVADGAQLQTMIEDPTPAGPRLTVAINDPQGTFDADDGTRVGMAGASLKLDREAVKALLQSCVDFLVRP